MALLLVLPARYRATDELPLLAWVGLVLLIDVAHVYGTLFQTCFDPVRRRERHTLLWVAPAACYAVGMALHSAGGLWFWRALAYLAVFHFIRQQYGFLRLYARREGPAPGAWLATAAIYTATLYPLAYWHLLSPRNFNWFVDSDFVQRDWPAGRHLATALYGALLVAYAGRELWLWRRTRAFNVPRNLLLAGTAVSWYVGIVWCNGDLAFTLLNVVSHGVPYLALVWQERPASATAAAVPRRGPWAGKHGWLLFLGLIGAFAYLEEGLWDGLVRREHAAVFGWFQALPDVSRAAWLAWLVPLLALPQSTHYVLDGFIWRRGAGSSTTPGAPSGRSASVKYQ